MNRLELVLWLVKNKSFYVFPLAKGTKIPVKGCRWKQESSNDEAQIEQWAEEHEHCNWALDCEKSGVTVVDVDVRAEKDGVTTLAMLQEEHGELPQTLTARTPRDGFHFYYKNRYTFAYQSGTDKLGKGVDIKSGAAYVAIPPSWWKEKYYKFQNKDAEIRELPIWVSELLQEKETKRREAPALINDAATVDVHASILEDAKAYLEREAPRCVLGDGSDANAYKVSCQLRDLGVGEQDALDLMLENWNEDNEPPWPPEKLAVKVKNAYTYASNVNPTLDVYSEYCKEDLAYLRRVEAQKKEEKAEQEAKERKEESGHLIKRVRLKDMLGEEPPEREWLAKDLIPRNAVTYLTGRPGVGKSLLALQLGIALATESDWCGVELEGCEHVVMLACEDDIDEVHRRSDSIARGLRPEWSDRADRRWLGKGANFEIWPRLGEDSNMVIVNGGNILKPSRFYKALKTILLKMEGRKLLVLDTAADVFGQDENNGALVNQFIKEFLGGLCIECDVTVLLVGHPPKAKTSHYAGSLKWESAPRGLLYLDYLQEESEGVEAMGQYRELTQSKANYSGKMKLTLEYTEGFFRRIAESEARDIDEEYYLGVMLEKIKEAAESGHPLGVGGASKNYIGSQDWRLKSGASMQLGYRKSLINKLVRAGKVENRSGRGKSGLFLA